MNNFTSKNIVRFIGVLLIQLFVMKSLFSDLYYLHVFIYPLFIMLLPFKLNNIYIMLLAFLLGILIDIWYHSIGVHTGALVFAAFMRRYILMLLYPHGGYALKSIPSKYHYGSNWFMLYVLLILTMHSLAYFSLEAFSFVYFKKIVLGILATVPVSWVFIMIYVLVLNPKE